VGFGLFVGTIQFGVVFKHHWCLRGRSQECTNILKVNWSVIYHCIIWTFGICQACTISELSPSSNSACFMDYKTGITLMVVIWKTEHSILFPLTPTILAHVGCVNLGTILHAQQRVPIFLCIISEHEDLFGKQNR
jgi:hypothetical protein